MTGVTKTVRGELRRIMNRPQTRSFDGAQDERIIMTDFSAVSLWVGPLIGQ